MAILSDSIRKKLEKNPNILKVTAKNVAYTPSFKARAVAKYAAGESYEDIFAEADIDLSLFEDDYARKSVDRWRKTIEKSGVEGFKVENRGRNSSGRPKGKKFKSLEAEVAYLRAENYFLKKLNALEAAFLKKKSTR
jgi:transposase-like protein